MTSAEVAIICPDIYIYIYNIYDDILVMSLLLLFGGGGGGGGSLEHHCRGPGASGSTQKHLCWLISTYLEH